MAVRAVVFDFYGTLVEALRWGPTHEEVLAGYGLAVDDAVRDAWRSEVFDGQDHAEHSLSRDAYRSWELARFRRMAQGCGAGPERIDAVAADLRDAAKAFELTPYPEVPTVLAALSQRGLTVAVCSNWDWDLDVALENVGLASAVDTMVVSARVGARKPHPRMFSTVLTGCGVSAEDALFVGDSWDCDVVGPLAVGMGAVHVWRAGAGTEADAPPLPPGAERVRDLRGVLRLVGS